MHIKKHKGMEKTVLPSWSRRNIVVPQRLVIDQLDLPKKEEGMGRNDTSCSSERPAELQGTSYAGWTVNLSSIAGLVRFGQNWHFHHLLKPGPELLK